MKLFFSVGEPSGDHHAARLLKELRYTLPEIEAIGFGGVQMEAAGCRVDFRLTDLAVMGILQVLPLIQKFRGLVRQATDLFRTERPDAVVLVDFPGFNWWISRAAKQAGIPVIYYCPPQLWAWAPWRISKVRKYVDHVLACLPFEAEWYQQRGIAVDCVGHPFFDDVAEHPLDAAWVLEQRRQPTRNIAVLPGSRRHEVHQNFPLQVRVLQQIAREVPGTRALVANCRPEHLPWCENYLREHAPELVAECHLQRTPEILESSEVCLMKSGSSSLEVLSRRVPAVVMYHVDWLVRLLGRFLITCNYMSLPNLIAGREVLPEFICAGRSDPEVEGMSRRLTNWLMNPAVREQQLDRQEVVREQVVSTGATRQAAAAILRVLGRSVTELSAHRRAA